MEKRTFASIFDTMQKRTFASMLDTMQKCQDELIELEPDQIKELLGDLSSKVDGLHDWLGKMDAEGERLAADIKTLQDRKKALGNAKQRYLDYIAHTMEANDSIEIFGNTWNVKLGKSEAVETSIEKPDTIHAVNYPEFVSTKYTWNKKSIKDAIKAGKDISELATIKKNDKITFKARGIK